MAIAASIALAAIFVFDANRPSGDSSAEPISGLIEAEAYRYSILDDDTGLDMKAGTRVEIEYTQDKRLVRLLEGEVYCAVSKDPNRPFVVEANGTQVSALGTAFSVAVEKGSLEVLVTEGSVLWERNAKSSTASTDTSQKPMEFRQKMEAGQHSRIAIDDSQSSVPVIDSFEETLINERLNWRHELIEFESVPLSDAIIEFNRRNKVQLKLEDPELGREPIVASVRSDDIEQFVRLLDIAAGVDSDRSIQGYIILRRRD